MTALFRSIEGRRPHGSDRLRERMRWVEAERRWHPVLLPSPPYSPPYDPFPPARLPPDHASLLRGALLTRFTTACAAAGASALKEQS